MTAVTVSGASGLRNTYMSVRSAAGSWLISGASRWLDAPTRWPAAGTASAAARATRATARAGLGPRVSLRIPPPCEKSGVIRRHPSSLRGDGRKPDHGLLTRRSGDAQLVLSFAED